MLRVPACAMAKVVPEGDGAQEEVQTDALNKMLAVVEVKAAREMTAEEQIAAFEEKLKKMRTPDNAACILDPRTEFRKKWDIVMIFLLLFTATVTPYEVCLMWDEVKFADPNWATPPAGPLFVINWFVNLIFMVDIVVR